MTRRWIEDPSLEAPDGHRWLKPAPECPNCVCHMDRVCRAQEWTKAWATGLHPRNADGTPYTKPCPCEEGAK